MIHYRTLAKIICTTCLELASCLQKSLTHDHLSIIVEIKMLQRETLVWPSLLLIYLYLTEQDLLYQQKRLRSQFDTIKIRKLIK